ncbi:MAG: site-specific integrase [Deltaproteobacteria bacterium]|nr:site-specific integrase [Deltaproteobacteria bacterium]
MAKPIQHRGKWRIRWLDENGERRSEVYDDRRDATFKLHQHQAEVEEIRRGLRAPTPPEKTFDELADYWIANRAAGKRSRKDDESIIRRHLRPAFGPSRLRVLGVQHVDRFVAERERLDRKTVANILTLLISMLRAARDLGWLAILPRIRKPRVPIFRRDYRYLRTDDEIIRFLTAARAEGENVFVLYAAAIYTGMRAGELAALLWEDVDLDGRLITVQRSFDGPTKSDRVRHVPILDPLLPVLRAWRLRCPGPLVFPNEAHEMHGPSARVFQEVLHRVLDAAGFPTTMIGDRVVRYIRFHDMRHTFASAYMRKGGDLFRLQKILGHQSIQMTMRYAHLAPSAFAADYGRLGGTGTLRSGEVVSLNAGKSE